MVDWPKGWRSIEDPALQKRLEAELVRETSPAHPPFGAAALAVGRRDDRDDVLFGLNDGRVAEVHLTWHVEPDPRWPAARLHASFEAWARRGGDEP